MDEKCDWLTKITIGILLLLISLQMSKFYPINVTIRSSRKVSIYLHSHFTLR